MKEKTNMRQFLEDSVAELAARYPLLKKPLRLEETDALEVALRIPCLLWKFAKTGAGYGAVKVSGKMESAHRMAFALAYQLDISNVLVCHHCDTPACYNPHHLFDGTFLDNNKDMRLKGRNKGFSIRGSDHPLSVYSESDVKSIRTEYVDKYGELTRLAKKYGGTPTAILSIVNRKTWTHV